MCVCVCVCNGSGQHDFEGDYFQGLMLIIHYECYTQGQRKRCNPCRKPTIADHFPNKNN